MSDQRNAWQRIHDIADKLVGAYKAAVLSALDAARDRLDLDALADAIERKDVPHALRLVHEATLGALQDPVAKATRDLLGAAGADATAVLERQIRARGEMRFDVLNPRAVQFIKARTAKLVKYVGDQQRGLIRAVVRDGFENGKHPYAMARDIKQGIGLLPDHWTFIQREAFKLRNGMGKDGASDDAIEAAVAKQIEDETERLLRYRAENIARTETIVSAYQGARESWRQADDADLLPPEATQEWIITEDDRLCDICEPLEGKTAKLDEEFAPGVEQPGDPHPSCRCGVVLRPFGVKNEGLARYAAERCAARQAAERAEGVRVALETFARTGRAGTFDQVAHLRDIQARTEDDAVELRDALRAVADAGRPDVAKARELLAQAREFVGPRDEQPILADLCGQLREDLGSLAFSADLEGATPTVDAETLDGMSPTARLGAFLAKAHAGRRMLEAIEAAPSTDARDAAACHFAEYLDRRPKLRQAMARVKPGAAHEDVAAELAGLGLRARGRDVEAFEFSEVNGRCPAMLRAKLEELATLSDAIVQAARDVEIALLAEAA